MIEMLRREYRLAAEEIAGNKVARSTVAVWLTRRSFGRLVALKPKKPPVQYQREHPGGLIHLDIDKLARFERWAITSRVTGATQARVPGTIAFMWRSMAPPGWPMSRCGRTRSTARPLPS
ncbi:hypothetical protein [Microvirga sp. VF16]|uniref:hypothetical protein n=1 Tax=Microvirga sp. VF16 TaxID=2807101 RepID=UPI00193D49DE|nr:hypothetical protein [Microvirga sp. VF16]QRM32859.1 hypothetical protein JO965_26275 [Microvirga sp. VF16]